MQRHATDANELFEVFGNQLRSMVMNIANTSALHQGYHDLWLDLLNEKAAFGLEL